MDSKSFFIWGLGLLGTSIAFDLKALGYRISGCVRSQKNLDTLRLLGFDDVFLDVDLKVKDILNNIDGIIIATPVESVPSILKKLMDWNVKPVFVTDVASTKVELLAWVGEHAQTLPFVGSHPMAGSDYTGPENAYVQMFRDAIVYMVCSDAVKSTIGIEQHEKAYQEISDFWTLLGSHPFEVSSEQHDKWAAYLSHGLHLVSCAVGHLVHEIPEVLEAPVMPAGGSFLDMTRVSGSNPRLWSGIINSNRAEVVKYLKSFGTLIDSWAVGLEDETLSLEEVFQKSGDLLKKFEGKNTSSLSSSFLKKK